MKNYFEDVAKLLGLELGEKFYIFIGNHEITRSGIPVIFFLAEDGLWGIHETNPSRNYDRTLTDLLCGKVSIEKLPIEPKMGDMYYTFTGEDFDINRTTWGYYAFDYAMKAANMMFRTAEEAKRARPAIYEKMTGKEWCE